MALEKRFIEQDTVVSKVTFIDEAYTMKVSDHVVRADATDGAFDLLLPPVSSAAGRFYSIVKRVHTNDITLKDQGDSELWSDQTLDKVDASILVYSDGMMWHILASDLS